MSTPAFLIDANLPRWFSLWSGDAFVFAHDHRGAWADDEVWRHAREAGLTNVTKDADFRIRVLIESPSKVIQVCFGNMKMRQFFRVMTARWPEAVALLPNHRLIELWADRVLAIS